jgi:hypothetical protein
MLADAAKFPARTLLLGRLFMRRSRMLFLMRSTMSLMQTEFSQKDKKIFSSGREFITGYMLSVVTFANQMNLLLFCFATASLIFMRQHFFGQ